MTIRSATLERWPDVRRAVWIGLLTVVVAGRSCAAGATDVDATSQRQVAPPRSFLSTPYERPGGRTLRVPSDKDLQAVLDTAQLGDVIVLQAGATYNGPFTLPNKSGGGWIYIQSSRYDDLPAPGRRVSSSHASLMPRIISPNRLLEHTPAVQTAAGAHHYRFIGIEFTTAPSTYTYNLVQLGWGETDPSKLPHDIIIDRCYVHADPVKGARRGVSLNGNSMAVIDSYVSDFKEVGADTQAVFGFNGFGPFKIVNNYLEAAGENVMFGGAAPTIANLVPSDIEIRHNLFSKPLSWKQGDPSYAGTPWSVKNLLELKIAQRVLIDGNEFKNNWPAAQQGYAVLFTPRAESGAAPQAVVQDITFTNNVVHDVAMGFDLMGADSYTNSTRRAYRIAVRNNLFYAVNGSSYGPGHLLVIADGITDFSFEHNTSVQNGNIISADGSPSTNFVFQNNVTLHNDYGVASPAGTGNPALAKYFPGAVFQKTVIVTSQWASLYPQKNFFPPSLDRVGFVDLAGKNFRLSSSSAYKNAATAGKDVGVDFDVLKAALPAEVSLP